MRKIRREDKLQWLSIYLSTVCPSCQESKDEYRWLCTKCNQSTFGSKERRSSIHACNKHFLAIYRQIEFAKSLIEPSTDTE